MKVIEGGKNMIYTSQRGARKSTGEGGGGSERGRCEDDGDSRFSHSRMFKSVRGPSRAAADGAFMYVKGLRRGRRGHFNVHVCSWGTHSKYKRQTDNWRSGGRVSGRFKSEVHAIHWL